MRHLSVFYPLSLKSAASAGATTDRGIIDQILVNLGVAQNTAHSIEVWAVAPIKVLLILVIAFALTRLERRYAVRIVHSMRLVSPLLQPKPEAAARAQTIAGVVSAIIRAVIWVIAGLTILDELGIRLGAFVAGATIIGAALGFGAQTLVKDFLSGMLILTEDQYGVGDNIVVNNTTGTVEGMTLRVTRIRSIDGVIWYVPNGDIRTVGNNSEGDSVALVEVVLPLGTDLEAAGRVAEDEARKMADEPDWAAVIVGEPTFAGIASVAADGATLRIMARTIPGEHQRAARELRLRLLERLRRDGLAWAAASSAQAESSAAASAEAERATAPTPPTASTPPASQPPTPRSRTARRSRRRQPPESDPQVQAPAPPNPPDQEQNSKAEGTEDPGPPAKPDQGDK